jgi:signal transduction histidine kinase
MTINFLQKLPLFSGIPPDDLQRMVDLAEPISLGRGHVLMKEGDQEDSLYIVLEGEFEISKRSGKKDVVIAVRGAGEVMGEMALLSEAPRSATVTALGPVRLLRLDKESFQSVLRSSPEAALAILETVTGRLRDTESMLRHHEKLSALGTLAAGLAHEINNPAGAIRSAAEDLKQKVVSLPEAGYQAFAVASDPETQRALEELGERLQESKRIALDSLERSDREADIEAWLEAAGVEEPWAMVGPLVAGGWTQQELATAMDAFGPESVGSVVEWLAQVTEAVALTSEVAQASERISSIVQSVKNYAYLDQAPEQVIDINQAIEDTLVILRHKLGEGIEVKKNFAEDLPLVEGLGSELTQVWTNLVDNAIDALEGKGTLTLETMRCREGAEVRICDDGPGIPAELKDRIFEPFYTTKAPGVGTGLGLHMVYNIVVQSHEGSVTVESEPGRTCFTVKLPARD